MRNASACHDPARLPPDASRIHNFVHSCAAAIVPSKAAAYFSVYIRRVSRRARGESVRAARSRIGVRAAIVAAAAHDVSHADIHARNPLVICFRPIARR